MQSHNQAWGFARSKRKSMATTCYNNRYKSKILTCKVLSVALNQKIQTYELSCNIYRCQQSGMDWKICDEALKGVSVCPPDDVWIQDDP